MVEIFCIDDDYEFNTDFEKAWKFNNVHGYGFVLQYIKLINEIVKELKAIQYTIGVLESWKRNDWFDINKTTYDVNWFNCPRKCNSNKKITLPQAKRLYVKTKEEYDLLFGILKETYRVHCKDRDGNLYDPNEFITQVDITYKVEELEEDLDEELEI